MGIPPGPIHLARLFPAFAIPSAVAYGGLTLLREKGIFAVPTWLLISATLLAKPALFILNDYYVRFNNKRKAKSLGAVVIPHIKEEWPRFGGVSSVMKVLEMVNSGYVADVYLDWAAKYGWVYELRYPTDSQIYTFEPDHIKAMLTHQFDNFQKGPIMNGQMKAFLGSGVFNSDGDMWKFHRTLTRPFFSRERVSDFDNFDAHSELALKQASSRLAEGQAFDFQDLVARFTLDSATQFLFGSDVGSLSAGLPYSKSSGIPDSPEFINHPSNIFVNAFLVGLDQIALRARMGAEWPLAEMLKDKVKPERAVVDRFIEPILQKALADKKIRDSAKEGKLEKVEKTTLLEDLVESTQDITIIKDELLNLLVAGRDTTASTLTFAFYMLAEHPHIARRLREEIFAKVGSTRRPTYDDMRELRYLRAFVNEVLRLYPPVPFDNRSPKKDCVWHSKDGSAPVFVPAGSTVIYGVFVMHRRTDLWGPDALEFDPDRFLDARVHKYLIPNPFIYCPFNAGPRICPGQQFAYHEASFFLVRLLQQFTDFSLAPDVQPKETLPPASWATCEGLKGKEKVVPGLNLTMFVKGGLWVRMKELGPTEAL